MYDVALNARGVYFTQNGVILTHKPMKRLSNLKFQITSRVVHMHLIIS